MLLPTSKLVVGESIAMDTNRSIRRRLSFFQAAQVAELDVYLGKTLAGRRGRSAAARTVAIRDPRLIREWKLALASSFHILGRGYPPESVANPRWDGLTFVLRDGRRVDYRLYGPYDVASYWGFEVERLYRRAVRQIAP